ncbi:MAG TPA: hypothetical protein DCG38_08815 [Eubacteriaceae bacterium]|jgi:predicted membrane-bound dolichyl-phosphate-mannose-protein mannosyltransferase|nr:hypothetical protein [Eubacteriaceae bacterium]
MNNYYVPPDISHIPNIRLYMDQMIEYLENILEPLMDEDDKALITKTMVNNYVKSGLIEKPEKKKYAKNQIMNLLITCHFKNVLSIDEISELFKIKEKLYSQEGFYLSYRKACLDIDKEVEDNEYSKDSLDYTIKAIIMSDYYKRMAKKSLKDKSVQLDD